MLQEDPRAHPAGAGPAGRTYGAENAWYRDLARGLAGPRDAQVMVNTFTALCERFRDEVDVDRFGPIGERLRARPRARGPSSPTAWPSSDPSSRARERVESWTVPGAGFEAMAPGLCRTYPRGRRAMTAARQQPSTANLHEWRKRAKYHWYHSPCWARRGPR